MLLAHKNKGYDEVKKVLSLTKYDSHKLSIYVDLKIVNVLFGQQSEYTSLPWFFLFV